MPQSVTELNTRNSTSSAPQTSRVGRTIWRRFKRSFRRPVRRLVSPRRPSPLPTSTAPPEAMIPITTGAAAAPPTVAQAHSIADIVLTNRPYSMLQRLDSQQRAAGREKRVPSRSRSRSPSGGAPDTVISFEQDRPKSMESVADLVLEVQRSRRSVSFREDV